jgi:uncharacterized metal-binding protein YceD (DUF177 family)
MTPELHRPISIDRIGPAGLDVVVEASEAERTTLARRMDLPALLALRCAFHLERDLAGRVIAHGNLHAEVVRTCIVSLEDFASPVKEQFMVLFVPAGEESDDADPELPDEIGYEDGVLDLGEAASEQLALALDPYPRAPGAALPEIEDGAEAHPFAALSALKRRQ